MSLGLVFDRELGVQPAWSSSRLASVVSGSKSAAAVLELRGLTKRYLRDGPAAVDGLSLIVPAGEVCVLVGPSGCGKTTALKMINRLIEPTSGDVLLDGVSVRARRPAQLRRSIGYVIQQVGLMPHLTIAANIATVPKLLGWDRAAIRARTTELLTLIGLDPQEYADRYPAELSGGQQQRVGLARALAADPPVMLMDEPFSAVDPITRERLQNDFLRLQRTVAKTVVFVTHDIDEAVKMADKVAVMRDGHLVQFATPADLLANPVDDFVADFVGADRALKGLSLTRIEEIDLFEAPAVHVGEPVARVMERIQDGSLTPLDGQILVTDLRRRPLDWRSLDEITSSGDRVGDADPGGAMPLIDQMATLRDALSALFEAGTAYGSVVNAEGSLVGLFSLDQIAGSLQRPGEAVRG
jgi:osmoprotectant transport system ATP-binding protein